MNVTKRTPKLAHPLLSLPHSRETFRKKIVVFCLYSSENFQQLWLQAIAQSADAAALSAVTSMVTEPSPLLRMSVSAPSSFRLGQTQRRKIHSRWRYLLLRCRQTQRLPTQTRKTTDEDCTETDPSAPAPRQVSHRPCGWYCPQQSFFCELYSRDKAITTSVSHNSPQLFCT